MGKRDESESEVDFEVAEGGVGEKEDAVVEGIYSGVKRWLIVFMLRERRELKNRMVLGEELRVASMERSKKLWRSWLLFSIMMVLRKQAIRRGRFSRR